MNPGKWKRSKLTCLAFVALSVVCALVCAQSPTSARANEAAEEKVVASQTMREVEVTVPWRADFSELAVLLEGLLKTRGQHDFARAIRDYRKQEVTERECRALLAYAAELANTCRNYGWLKEATEVCLLISSISRELDDEYSSSMAQILTLQGVICVDQDQYDEARNCFAQALEIYVKHYPEKVEQSRALWWYLSRTEIALGSYERAEEISQELLMRTDDEGTKLRPSILASLIEVHLLQGNRRQAQKFVPDILAAIKAGGFEEVKAKSFVLSRVAMVYADAGNIEQAAKVSELALELATREKGFLSVVAARRHKDHADILLKQDRFEEAREHLQAAIDTYGNLHGESHRTVRVLQDRLAELEGAKGNGMPDHKVKATQGDQQEGVTPVQYAD